MYIGNHLSSSKGFENMGKEALKLGADTFAFFTRNPRGGAAKEIDPEDALKLRRLMEEHQFGTCPVYDERVRGKGECQTVFA